MPSTGTIEVDGHTYTWLSPTLGDLERFEATIGPISDSAAINSVKGRIWLCWACLRESQPDLTLKQIGEWPADAWNAIWATIQQAIPLWGPASGEDEKKKEKTSASPDTSASPAPDSGGGPLPSPVGSG